MSASETDSRPAPMGIRGPTWRVMRAPSGLKIEKKTDAYFDTLAGWTHGYVNFETAGAVEIEIARVNGQPIRNAAVHPKRKASACTMNDGKVIVRLDQPCLVAVDIDTAMVKMGNRHKVAQLPLLFDFPQLFGELLL